MLPSRKVNDMLFEEKMQKPLVIKINNILCVSGCRAVRETRGWSESIGERSLVLTSWQPRPRFLPSCAFSWGAPAQFTIWCCCFCWWQMFYSWPSYVQYCGCIIEVCKVMCMNCRKQGPFEAMKTCYLYTRVKPSDAVYFAIMLMHCKSRHYIEYQV